MTFSSKRSTCDYDTSQMIGDRYITEVQINDPSICRTSFCLERFTEEISSNIQRHSSLTLPFTLPNGTLIRVSMILCKFNAIFTGLIIHCFRVLKYFFAF